MAIREINDDDIEAAVRGLHMRSLNLSDHELRQMVLIHAPKTTMFASQVIAGAARKVLTERLAEATKQAEITTR